MSVFRTVRNRRISLWFLRTGLLRMDHRAVSFPKCGPFSYVSVERVDSHWR
uniref:Uncharacterized protein n=1 Tax=Heterorhabditis bacteriophora TaxID=37862 RepID=A0A1I7XR06_HETBA